MWTKPEELYSCGLWLTGAPTQSFRSVPCVSPTRSLQSEMYQIGERKLTMGKREVRPAAAAQPQFVLYSTNLSATRSPASLVSPASQSLPLLLTS